MNFVLFFSFFFFGREVLCSTVDPLYQEAWQLHSTDEVFFGHINVVDVWNAGFTGKDVVIGFSGMPDTTHRELKDRFINVEDPIEDGNHEVEEEEGGDQDDVTPSDGNRTLIRHAHTRHHDTRHPHTRHIRAKEIIDTEIVQPVVDTEMDDLSLAEYKTAAVAVAVGNANNGVCSRGVAYDAMFGVLGFEDEGIVEMNWLRRRASTKVDIFVVDAPPAHNDCRRCWQNIDAVTSNGGVVVLTTGKGGVNGNCNHNLYTNAPFTIAVAPHSAGGMPAHAAEFCPNTIVSVPVGDHNSSLGLATAAKAPDQCKRTSNAKLASSVAAGVVALMMQASNFSLSAREIAHILIETATTPTSLAWVENGAGFRHHPLVGFGNIDADKAVRAARGTEKWGEFLERRPIEFTSAIPRVIGEMGFTSIGVPITAPSKYRVDWVTVEMDVNHDAASDLRIVLTSPSGTMTVFSAPQAMVLTDKLLVVNTSHTGHSNTFPILPSNDVADSVLLDHWEAAEFQRPVGGCCSVHDCKMPKRTYRVKSYLLLDPSSSCYYDTQVTTINRMSPPNIIILGSRYPRLVSTTRAAVFSMDAADFRTLKAATLQDAHSQAKFGSHYSKPKLTLRKWKFSSTQFWLEHVAGLWALLISDDIPHDGGQVKDVRITFHTLELV